MAGDDSYRADPINVTLTGPERTLLRCALNEWTGPARVDRALARLLGFSSAAAMVEGCLQLRDRLGADGRLSATEWRTVLLAAEIAFASDVVGSGVDWSSTTGIDDHRALDVLRALQRKLARSTSMS